MSLHQTTGHWKLGLLLSLITTLFWGVLSVALKLLLTQMDAFTITWYRFLTAIVVLVIYIIIKKRPIPIQSINKKIGGLLLIAAVGLTGNYIVFMLGLKYLPPSTAQIVIQLAPMLLLVGGIVIFKERFFYLQWAGFAIFFIGLLLFFNHRLMDLVTQISTDTIGILFIIMASVGWASYALAQKQLLKTFSSEVIMVILYVTGLIVLTPLSHPARLFNLDTLRLFLLFFAAANTLIAYGCFAEALHHWDASRVSAVITTVPVITFLSVAIVSSLAPAYLKPDVLNWISYAGALLVIVGSMTTALAKQRKKLI